MALLRNDPMHPLGQLSRQLEQLLEPRNYPPSEPGSTHASDWTPAVDITEDADRFVILVDVPGVKSEDIDVTMDRGVLTIKGKREQVQVATGFTRQERIQGTFLRRFTLPDTADHDKVSARTRDGVLEVEIPKAEPAKSKKITVSS